MPTYDYQCQACGHKLELFQSFSEAPKRKCPQCGKSRLERLIGTGAGVLFKGSGFYQTDYRSDSYKQGETAEKSGDKSSADKSPSDKPASDSKAAGSGDKGSAPPDKQGDKQAEKPAAKPSAPTAPAAKGAAKKRDKPG